MAGALTRRALPDNATAAARTCCLSRPSSRACVRRKTNSSQSDLQEPKDAASKSSEAKGRGSMARLGAGLSHRKLFVFFCINIANLACHAVYSVLAAFFPQEAKAKGMSDDGVGIVFASFAAVIFVCSPLAGRLMTKHGKVRARTPTQRGERRLARVSAAPSPLVFLVRPRNARPGAGGWPKQATARRAPPQVIVYLWGLLTVSVATTCFAAASVVPAGWPFYTFCLVMRLMQGVGSALEETAAYAIIADIEPDRGAAARTPAHSASSRKLQARGRHRSLPPPPDPLHWRRVACAHGRVVRSRGVASVALPRHLRDLDRLGLHDRPAARRPPLLAR
eukprot:7207991-Prymnesium_polylepis.1